MEERYFQPEATALTDRMVILTGVISDYERCNGQRHLDEMKRGLISTVSHEFENSPDISSHGHSSALEEKKWASLRKTDGNPFSSKGDSRPPPSNSSKLVDISRMNRAGPDGLSGYLLHNPWFLMP